MQRLLTSTLSVIHDNKFKGIVMIDTCARWLQVDHNCIEKRTQKNINYIQTHALAGSVNILI